MIQKLFDEIEALKAENDLLRKTIEVQKRQVQAGAFPEEMRRLRAKIAEWEGSTRYINNGYYHGGRFISPYMDDDDSQ